MFWVSITGPKCAQPDPRCVRAASTFFSKRMRSNQGQTRKKRSRQYFCTAFSKEMLIQPPPRYCSPLYIERPSLEPFIKGLPFFHYVALSPNL